MVQLMSWIAILFAVLILIEPISCDKREYTASFSLTNAINTNVWIQWGVDPDFWNTVTPWYSVGSLSSGSHSFTKTMDDIGAGGYHFKLGMFGTGSQISTMIYDISTMNGISSDETTYLSLSFSFTISSDNCYIIALNTYYDTYYIPSVRFTCNDYYGLETNIYVPTTPSFVFPFFSIVSLFFA